MERTIERKTSHLILTDLANQIGDISVILISCQIDPKKSIVENIGEMAEEISSESDSFVVKNIQNVHHMKTDVVKFNDKQF